MGGTNVNTPGLTVSWKDEDGVELPDYRFHVTITLAPNCGDCDGWQVGATWDAGTAPETIRGGCTTACATGDCNGFEISCGDPNCHRGVMFNTVHYFDSAWTAYIEEGSISGTAHTDCCRFIDPDTEAESCVKGAGGFDGECNPLP
jgi:hypothetical protein